MNDHVKKLHVAILDNRVIAAGTNTKDFYNSFVTATGYKKGYHTFRKLIKPEPYFIVSIGDIDYYFQNLV